MGDRKRIKEMDRLIQLRQRRAGESPLAEQDCRHFAQRNATRFCQFSLPERLARRPHNCEDPLLIIGRGAILRLRLEV